MTPSTDSIESLEPAPVWRLFAGMAAVPRPSKKEQRIRAHIRAVAEEHGFGVREDAAGNIVIDVPATPGCQQAPVTVLQGHLDMVCEKNSGTRHDFDNDPIRLIIDTDAAGEQIVRADGTTLGADNGIGVAMAMAAAVSPDVTHGPLELLCTVDEEAGMTGAKALPADLLKGRRLLNLDSEEDDVIYIGCAGGCDTTLTWSFATGPVPAGAECCRVTVAGLKGGHSGCDIHLNRGNAIKLLVRMLAGVPEGQLQLTAIEGGSLRNAIPREAQASVAGPAGITGILSRAAAAVQAEVVREQKEAHCTIRVERGQPDDRPSAISHADTQRLLHTVAALPSGVLAVVPDIPGLIETSNNVATLKAASEAAGAVRITVECLARSSSASQLQSAVRQVTAAGRLASAAVQSGNEYPGWRPNVDSPTLATCRRVYEELFGETPNVTAIHAGLECGLLGERVGGGMDMVSFGPRIEGAHSPDERVYVKSVQKSWKYLTAVLSELARG